MRPTKHIKHLFKAEKGIALALDRVNEGGAQIDHGRIVLDPMVVITVSADDILEEPWHVATRLNVGLAQIPRDLSTDALRHLVGILVNLLILLKLLLLGRDLLGPVRLLDAEKVQPDLLSKTKKKC